MKTDVSLKQLVGKPLLILEIAVFVLCLVQITLTIGYLVAGLMYALPFSVITVLIVRYFYIALLAPCCDLRDDFHFSMNALTQTRKGVTVKEVALDRGLNVYRYGGIMRTTLVFSRRELPQGEILRTYKKDPEVVFFPYVERKMPKLKKYYDKATRI